MSPFPKFKTIGLMKEGESPENPGGLEKRVALVPEDVKQLVKKGVSVFVEEGAGLGVGFEDYEYVEAGASLQTGEEILEDKDLLIGRY